MTLITPEMDTSQMIKPAHVKGLGFRDTRTVGGFS